MLTVDARSATVITLASACSVLNWNAPRAAGFYAALVVLLFASFGLV